MMQARELAERAYFVLCLNLAWLLRSGRYSKARIVNEDGELLVRKHRLFYAPLLVTGLAPRRRPASAARHLPGPNRSGEAG